MSSYLKLKLSNRTTILQMGEVHFSISFFHEKNEHGTVTTKGIGEGVRFISFTEIVQMEIGHDVLLIMEDELRKVPFDVSCPENDLLEKAMEETDLGDIIWGENSQ